MVTCECYIAMLEIEGHLQALNIEEKRVTVEPTEDLEEISLDDDTLGRTARISTQADPSVRKELSLFLKKNRDVFAQSHEDMLGISPSAMVHKLNVCVDIVFYLPSICMPDLEKYKNLIFSPWGHQNIYNGVAQLVWTPERLKYPFQPKFLWLTLG